MAASVKNKFGKPTKLTRGSPANLGTITAANDVVAFTVSEPSNFHQAKVVIQVASGLTNPTFAMEFSLDGGNSWTDIPLTPVLTADFGDTAASGGMSVDISGQGSGAIFRFGRTDGNGGAAAVWALVG